jgi:hypothetical protein
MMTRNRVLILSLFVLTAAALTAAAADAVSVAGAWTITVKTPRGDRTSTLTFVQDGEKLTVTSKNEHGEATGTGTLKGSDISWSITRDTPRGKMTFTYSGKVDGNTMSGETQTNGGSSPWAATRNT